MIMKRVNTHKDYYIPSFKEFEDKFEFEVQMVKSSKKVNPVYKVKNGEKYKLYKEKETNFEYIKEWEKTILEGRKGSFVIGDFKYHMGALKIYKFRCEKLSIQDLEDLGFSLFKVILDDCDLFGQFVFKDDSETYIYFSVDYDRRDIDISRNIWVYSLYSALDYDGIIKNKFELNKILKYENN